MRAVGAHGRFRDPADDGSEDLVRREGGGTAADGIIELLLIADIALLAGFSLRFVGIGIVTPTRPSARSSSSSLLPSPTTQPTSYLHRFRNKYTLFVWMDVDVTQLFKT
eukprot:GHVS01033920.1.p2 GENE.GHVS01033920.1~~GHVS01033920.1.p2  ORF type:complete len:109 (+),score=22.74 GHVS01033920.1:541-867(+)